MLSFPESQRLLSASGDEDAAGGVEGVAVLAIAELGEGAGGRVGPDRRTGRYWE